MDVSGALGAGFGTQNVVDQNVMLLNQSSKWLPSLGFVPPELELVLGAASSRLAIEFHGTLGEHQGFMDQKSGVKKTGSMIKQDGSKKTDSNIRGLKGRKRLKSTKDVVNEGTKDCDNILSKKQ